MNVNSILNHIEQSGMPLTIKRHAMVVAHLFCRKLTEAVVSSDEAAKACMLFTIKSLHRTGEIRQLTKTITAEQETTIIGIELFLCEYVREKILLVENCFRILLREILLSNPSITHPLKETLCQVALALCDRVYKTPYCILPEESAAACLKVSLDSIALSEPVVLGAQYDSPQVCEIAQLLRQAPAPTASTAA